MKMLNNGYRSIRVKNPALIYELVALISESQEDFSEQFDIGSRCCQMKYKNIRDDNYCKDNVSLRIKLFFKYFNNVLSPVLLNSGVFLESNSNFMENSVENKTKRGFDCVNNKNLTR